MPPKLQRRVTLSAGEECTVSGNGPVQVTLLTGAVDIAGCALEPNRPTPFLLAAGARSIVLYTLEGGAVSLASDSPVAVHKAATGAAALVQLTRRTLMALDRATVLVIGDHRGGKTLAAHALANMLRRYATETEEAGSQATRVCLLDVNAESNALFCPGCVSALELPPGAANLWLGTTAAPTQLPLSFYTGLAARPSSKDVSGFIHFCEQLYDTTVALLDEETSRGYGQKLFTVIDAPTPEADLKEGIFYKKLIEIVKPTHVVVVGSRETMQAGDDWCNFLQEDVQRILPDCDFAFVEPCGKPCAQAPKHLLCQEYFVGTPAYPLGGSKVVVSGQSVQFVALDLPGAEGPGSNSSSSSGGGFANAAVVAQKVNPSKQWKGLICALSHAETLEEVPLAPTAGLLVVSMVDEENDEIVLIVPAARQEPLQRRFVVVPGVGRGQESLRVSETQNAIIEESIVV